MRCGGDGCSLRALAQPLDGRRAAGKGVAATCFARSAKGLATCVDSHEPISVAPGGFANELRRYLLDELDESDTRRNEMRSWSAASWGSGFDARKSVA